MRKRHWLMVGASLLSSVLVGSPNATSQTVSVDQDAKGRQVYRDERPDDSRGWMIVTKASYWPLAYEAYDRLEETKELIGQSKPDELADSLDKVAAWLQLAGSAAMTDGRAGVESASELCSDAADSLRGGSKDWNDEKLTQLVTLAQLSMAKSHFLRARAADEDTVSERQGRESQKTDSVREATTQIAAAKQELATAQYRFDTRESLRHLTVGRDYYQAACKSGGLPDELADSFTSIPELPADASGASLVDFQDDEIRPRVEQGLRVVNAQRKKLSVTLDE